MARARGVEQLDSACERADGEGVSFRLLPDTFGPSQYLWEAREMFAAVREEIRPTDAVILRVPSQMAYLPEILLRRRGQPYGVEVVADPYDGYAPGARRHPLRPLLRAWHCRRLRSQCRGASATAYVTCQALQRRYPPAAGTFTTHYSSIQLCDEDFVESPRSYSPEARSCRRLITIGSLNHMHKGLDVFIDAVSIALGQGLDLKLTLLGDGILRPDLEAKVRALGLQDRISFRGHILSRADLRGELDQSDLFVLPSRQEGLPRAMIEAMARGLACIGTTVGGIPELLAAEDLVPPADAAALARKIQQMAQDPGRRMRSGEQNLRKAREYHEAHLRRRRDQHYSFLKSRTEAWSR